MLAKSVESPPPLRVMDCAVVTSPQLLSFWELGKSMTKPRSSAYWA